MTITLFGFPEPTDRTFTPGTEVKGFARFVAENAAEYSSLGYQVVVDNCKGNVQATKVIRTVTLARKVTFAAGESRDFPIIFSIMGIPSHTGELFSLHPGLRGFARPAKRGSVALHRAPNFCYLSATWQYRSRSLPFRPEEVLKMKLVVDEEKIKVGLLPLAWLGSIFLFAIPPYGFILLLFLWSAVGFYYVNEVDYSNQFAAPAVRLETRGKTLLAFISFTNPPKGIRKLTAGYVVRELSFHTIKHEEQVIRKRILPLEPQQTIDLNQQDESIAEHQLQNLPLPGRWNDYGYEWVYQVRATVGEKTWLWEGTMEASKE
ncbi:MAG: hypothetical protein AAGF89_00870 [Bacteroidota bacterium]